MVGLSGAYRAASDAKGAPGWLAVSGSPPAAKPHGRASGEAGDALWRSFGRLAMLRLLALVVIAQNIAEHRLFHNPRSTAQTKPRSHSGHR